MNRHETCRPEDKGGDGVGLSGRRNILISDGNNGMISNRKKIIE